MSHYLVSLDDTHRTWYAIGTPFLLDVYIFAFHGNITESPFLVFPSSPNEQKYATCVHTHKKYSIMLRPCIPSPQTHLTSPTLG